MRADRPGRGARANGATDDALIAQWAAEAGFARLVVIKTLFADDQRGKYESLLEATKKAAGLHHPNVRQIHELGSAGGHCYLAVEYLEGVTFDTLLRSRARAQALADPRLYCALLAQACEGIHHAHSRLRLLHGALRPEKLFVTSGGTVKILGLGLGGLAAMTADTKALAEAARYSYTSPEQILGRRVGAGADVFALGIIAWEALTGRRLFSRPTRVEVYRAITEKPIPSPRALAPSVPASLDRAVARALASNPAERYKSTREFGLALEEGVGELGAPLSTVAIASIVDRCFSQELEKQRTVVQRARQRLAAGTEGDEDIFEVPTRLYEGGFEQGNDTRKVSDEDLALLAAGSADPGTGHSNGAANRVEVPDPMPDIVSERRMPDIATDDRGAGRETAPVANPFEPTEFAPAPAAIAPEFRPEPEPAPAQRATAAIIPRSQLASPKPLDDLFSIPDDPMPRDLRPRDLRPQDLRPRDLRPQDLGPHDLRPQDLGPHDLRPQDLGPQDLGPHDLHPQDLGPQDLSPRDLGPPPSPREFQRPPETLSDVGSVADVNAALATDFESVPTAPPSGLGDADAAAAAAGAEIAPSIKKKSGRGLLIILALILLACAGGFAYYELVHKPAQSPPSPVKVGSIDWR